MNQQCYSINIASDWQFINVLLTYQASQFSIASIFVSCDFLCLRLFLSSSFLTMRQTWSNGFQTANTDKYTQLEVHKTCAHTDLDAHLMHAYVCVYVWVLSCVYLCTWDQTYRQLLKFEKIFRFGLEVTL